METIRSNPLEQEHAEQPVDTIVVLGKNWRNRWRIPRYPQEGTEIMLSEDSMRSTIAGAELFIAGKTNDTTRDLKLIFSTGHTIGKEYPAEAEAMKMYLRHFYTEEEIPDEDILLEDRSPDTPGNVIEVKKVADENNLKTIKIVTVDYHLPRTVTLFENQGMQVYAASAESILEERGFTLQERSLLKKAKEQTLEFGLRQLLKIDPNGTLPRRLTSFIRS